MGDVTITTRLSGIEEAQKALGGLGTRLQGFGDSATRLGRTLSVGVTAPLTAAVGSLAAFARSTANTGNEIAKTARSAGLGGEAFQELSFALGQVSSLTESEVARSFQFLNTALGKAAEGGNKTTEIFAGLGFELDDIMSGSIGTEQAFDAVVKALREMESPAQAAALSAELFGRAGRELGPILRESGGDIDALRERFQELGVGMSDDALAASEKFVDRMDELTRQFGSLGREIGAAVLPLVNDLVPVIQESVIPALRTVVGFVTDAIRWFRELPGPVQETAAVVAAALGAGGPVLLAIGTAAKVIGALFIAGTGPIALLIGAGVLIFAAWQRWGDQITELVESVAGWIGETFTAIRDTAVAIWTALAEGILAAIRAPFEAVMSVVNGVADGVVGAFSWLKDTVVGNSIVPDMVDEVVAEFARMGDGITVETDRGMAAVQSAFTGQGAGIVVEARRATGGMTDTFKDAASTIGGIADTLGRGFQQQFANIMRGTVGLGEAMKSIFNNVVADILNEFAKVAASRVFQVMFGTEGPVSAPPGGLAGGGGIGIGSAVAGISGTLLGGLLGGPIGASIGGLLGSLFGSFLPFQTGFRGIVTGPMPFIAGERGPEMVEVTPLSAMGRQDDSLLDELLAAGSLRMGGVKVVNVNVQPSGLVVYDDVTMAQMERRIGRMVDRELRRVV